MKLKTGLFLSVAAIAVAAWLGAPASVGAQQGAPAAVTVGASDLGGVVRSASGPEAGVWVIAETTDLPTKFAKMVVTDDQGRYVLPELPAANYEVWVRGYGLVNSPKVQAKPGSTLNLTAVAAPNAAAAAEYYPAIYWFSMLQVPDKSHFPGTGPNGNGISTNVRSQAMWLDGLKTNGCVGCHQMGNKATRTIPKELGPFNSTYSSLGAAHPVRAGERLHGARCWPLRHPGIAERLRRLDRPDRRRRAALRPSLSARRASSATSSSACGIGAVPRCTCTTRSRPTGATRRSTPMARCSARRNGARITCRCSIRSRTPRPTSSSHRAIPRRSSSIDDPMFASSRLLGR